VGVEDVKRHLKELMDAFPDVQFLVDDVVSEGDDVVVRWTATLTHTGDYFGIPPTNKSATITGMNSWRVENGFLGWALPRVWAIPINRASADREAIQRATDLLQRGEPIGMFPEGTRRKPGAPVGESDLGEAHAGVAFIAMRAGVPVVPVGIAGTDKALPPGAKLPRFPRVTIKFGPPVSPHDFPHGGRKEKTAAMTAEIMRRIAAARDAATEE
jgi:1-acyl-sn-glycerol-3-phosphate acyltransferase